MSEKTVMQVMLEERKKIHDEFIALAILSLSMILGAWKEGTLIGFGLSEENSKILSKSFRDLEGLSQILMTGEGLKSPF